jgi:putative FmdB family regulatory protein
MPTYEYECTKCSTVTEVFQSITESPRRRLKKTDDPACTCGATVQRLIGTGAGIIFKGSGFYQTDYRSESYKKAAKAEKDAAAGKSESKTGGDGKAGKKGDAPTSASTAKKDSAPAKFAD